MHASNVNNKIFKYLSSYTIHEKPQLAYKAGINTVTIYHSRTESPSFEPYKIYKSDRERNYIYNRVPNYSIVNKITKSISEKCLENCHLLQIGYSQKTKMWPNKGYLIKPYPGEFFDRGLDFVTMLQDTLVTLTGWGFPELILDIPVKGLDAHRVADLRSGQGAGFYVGTFTAIIHSFFLTIHKTIGKFVWIITHAMRFAVWF